MSFNLLTLFLGLVLAASVAEAYSVVSCPSGYQVVAERQFQRDLPSSITSDITGLPESKIIWSRGLCARDNRIKHSDDYSDLGGQVNKCVRAAGLGDQSHGECMNRFNTQNGAKEGRDVQLILYNWHNKNYQSGRGQGEVKFTGAAVQSVNTLATGLGVYGILGDLVELIIRIIMHFLANDVVPQTWVEFKPLTSYDLACSLAGVTDGVIEATIPDGFRNEYYMAVSDGWFYIQPKTIGIPGTAVACKDQNGQTISAEGYSVRIKTDTIAHCTIRATDVQKVGVIYKYSVRTLKYYKWMHGLKSVTSKTYYFAVSRVSDDQTKALAMQICSQNQALVGSNTRSMQTVNVTSRLADFWAKQPDIEGESGASQSSRSSDSSSS